MSEGRGFSRTRGRNRHLCGDIDASVSAIFLLVTQAILNIAVVTGLAPTKGLPLPLMSYGGTSLLTTGLLVGVLLSLSRETR